MTMSPSCGSSASAARSTFAAPRSAPPPCAACLKYQSIRCRSNPPSSRRCAPSRPPARRCRRTHAVEVMRGSYSGYVQNNTQHFRTLFAHLLEDRAPLVIHCTAGKDRTGFACALILHTLGVSERHHLGRLSPDQPLLPQGSQSQHRSARRDQAGARLGAGIVPRRRVRGHRRRLWRSRKLSSRWPRSRQSRTRPSRSALSAS